MDDLYRELFMPEPEIISVPEENLQQEPEENTSDETETKTASTENKRPLKKILFAFSAVVALILAAVILIPNESEVTPTEPVQVQETMPSGSCGTALAWEYDESNRNLIISGTGVMDDYAMDENPAPWNNLEVRSVTIETGVTSIGAFSFFGMDTIEQVAFPETLELVSSHAFWGCQIAELSLPESLKRIEESAFSVNPVVNVVIPDGVEYLDKGCFDCCEKLKSVTIGANTRLNYDIWYGPMFGNGGSNITIRGFSNTMVEDYARIFNHSFESIGKNEWDIVGTEPGGNNSVKWYFDKDTGFLLINGATIVDSYLSTDPSDPKAYVTFNQVPGWMEVQDQIVTVSFDSIYGIGSYSFAHCTNLTDVSFGETLGHIGYGAFLDTNLDEVNFSTLSHDGNGQIHPFAFAECGNLREVVLSNTLSIINKSAFSGCPALETFYAETYFNNFCEADNHSIFTSDAYPELPKNLTVYGLKGGKEEASARKHGFRFATGLWRLLPEEEGQCGENAWWFKSGDTLIISGSNQKMWNYKTDLTQKQLEEGKKVSNMAPTEEPEYKKYSSEVRNLRILPGVVSIGSGAFMGMSGLEEISIETVGNLDILDYAFSDCDTIESIVIPAGVVVLDSYAFANCDNLQKIYLRGGKVLHNGAFANCPSLEGIWFFGTSHYLYQILGDSYSKDIVFHAHPNHKNVFNWVNSHGIVWSGEFLY